MINLAVAIALAATAPTIAQTQTEPSDCAQRRPPSSAAAAHQRVRDGVGRKLPATDNQVLLFIAGGHHMLFADSIAAVRLSMGGGD